MKKRHPPRRHVIPTADLAAPARPVMTELSPVAGGRDITRGVVDMLPLLPPQDEWQGRAGGFPLDTYRQVLDDSQVMAALCQRRLGVVATEWEVLPGGTSRQDKKAAALIEAILAALPWDAITAHMHYGVFYGHALAEILWQRDGTHIVPESIQVRDQRRFAWRPDGTLMLLTVGAPLGEPLPPKKFWTYATGATHADDPYGMGLAHWCYWPVQFKRGIAKLWLIALDKYASPTALGHFPPGASEDERAKLLAALEAIRSQAALILPDGMTAELLASSRSGGADYDVAARYWDNAVSKVILGHSAGADATPGRLGGEDGAGDVRADLVTADADILCGSANATWVRWVTEWSFPGAMPPKVWRRTTEDEDLSARAARERLIFDMGYRPTLAQIIDTYDGEWERVAAPAAPAEEATAGGDADDAGDGAGSVGAGLKPAPTDSPTAAPASRVGAADPDDKAANLAAPLPRIDGQDLIDAELARDTSALQQAAMERLLAPILAALADGLTPEEIMARMDDWYGALDDSLLQELLERGLAAADAIGRLEAQAEARA